MFMTSKLINFCVFSVDLPKTYEHNNPLDFRANARAPLAQLFLRVLGNQLCSVPIHSFLVRQRILKLTLYIRMFLKSCSVRENMKHEWKCCENIVY